MGRLINLKNIGKPRITFGRLIAHDAKWENDLCFTNGFMHMAKDGYKLHIEDLHGIDFKLDISWRGGNVATNRNKVFKAAIARGDDYVVFFDDDMVVPDFKGAVEKMIAIDKDIVAAIGVTRGKPYWPNITKVVQWGDSFSDAAVHRIYEFPEDKPFQVDAVGTAFMVIKKRVWQKMKAPWFYMPPDNIYGDIKGEDTTFCFNAKCHGFEVWVDPSIEMGHIGEFAFGLKPAPTSFAEFKDYLLDDSKKAIESHGWQDIENCNATHNLVPEIQAKFKEKAKQNANV